MNKVDVIVIGSGIAALQLAHHISVDKNVRILTKSNVKVSNSSLAQGGIAASIGADDDVSLHCNDTMEAGRFHNNEEVVKVVTEEAPLLIKELYEAGCPFDQDATGKLKLGMEGAHSHYRIVHSGGDATGKNVIDFLVATIPKNTSIIENMFAYELLLNDSKQCIGVKAKDEAGIIHYFYADHIVIATGGCSNVYSLSAGSPNVIGDGIAMAYLAGAEITDMEFIQFHPTMLIKDGEVKGLISEAVRGQGAKLVTKKGVPIMEGVHPLKDLAPRHVVSQTIYDYIHNGEEVFLDISSIEHFEEKFPTITNICISNGINLKDGLIPVAPGSHFLMGGIKVDLKGQTNVPGLYAIGEAACTGLHGANRLASNSLLEGLAFGKRLAQHINSSKTVKNYVYCVDSLEKMPGQLVIPHFSELRERMMENVGIVRTEESLLKQKEWLEGYVRLDQVIPTLDHFTISEIQSILATIIALLITDAALNRTESRGGHFRADYPMENTCWQNKHLVYQYFKGRSGTNEQNQTTDHVGAVFC